VLVLALCFQHNRWYLNNRVAHFGGDPFAHDHRG